MFYSYVTQIAGFKAGKHEGKITGLAAYGKPEHIEIFKKLVVYENGTFRNIGGVFFQSALKAIQDALPPDYKKEDLAASIQTYLEHMIIDYVGYWLERTGSANVALAGGVFANVLINQKIYEIPGVQSVHVRQSDIKQNPIGAMLPSKLDALCGVGSGDNGESGNSKRFLRQFTVDKIILNEHHDTRCCSDWC